MKLGKKEIEALTAMEREDQSGWLPWSGFISIACRLEDAGLAIKCGVSVMAPFVLFCLTDAGRAALKEHRNA